jgi:hypothetical protein
MSFIKKFLVIIAVLIPAISAAVEKSSNYPLYSLNDVVAHEVSSDSKSLFTIEQNDAGSFFVRRNMATGETTLNIQLDVSETYLLNTVIVDDEIFVFHVMVKDREKRLFETTIFKIDSDNGKVTNLYESMELLGFAERFYATKTGLLLTEKRGNNPFLFSFETNKMTALKLEDDFRIRAFDRARNCAIIIRQSNFSTSFEGNDEKSSYTEGDGSLLDVYLCDFSSEYALQGIGQYQPNYVLSNNEAEAFLPHFILESSEYDWVGPSFMVNRFPIYPGALIGDSNLNSSWESLVDYEMITEISFVSDHYSIASQFSETGETSLVVFDLKNPKLMKDETVGKEDRQRIKALFMGQSTTEKSVLDPAILSKVFDAAFYKVSLVTTSVDSSDGYVSSYTTTESFTAVAKDMDFSVFKQNENLVSCISKDFLLDQKSALLFQDALDVLMPVGHFAQEHKTFYQEADRWIFVRDESFGEKVGIVVNVDEDGKIIGINPEEKLVQQ